MRWRPLDILFWVLVLAIVTVTVRPGSKAGQAVAATAQALAAIIGTATGAAAAAAAGGSSNGG